MKPFSIRAVVLEVEGEREALFFLADRYEDAKVEGGRLYIRLPLVADVSSVAAASRLLSEYLETLKKRAKEAMKDYELYQKVSRLLERGKNAASLDDLGIPVIE